eukprot:CAMPEP_0197306186 /NCGR_PEP_ID=MMETSP0891-20130614/2843_1 /TAXON_ID=44058 ORGANISM="Aureoumbra lagunensis, Strain CCMP1510" /NCGR_SAMPLE_ID=MMETSP0891 /ASSEMBLY_ACC=CAM_ASM_000534 /LENGTH=56 /DNA_ID=CAMNT_0042788131 /DNA_START=678 /DNA_END=848 /DNA_ORIENTATION=+
MLTQHRYALGWCQLSEAVVNHVRIVDQACMGNGGVGDLFVGGPNGTSPGFWAGKVE